MIAFALSHPGLWAAAASRPSWPGTSGATIRISEHGIWRVLSQGRAQHQEQAAGADRPPPRPLRAQARHPAARAPHRRLRARPRRSNSTVSIVGRLSGTKGTVWQYSAIDVASAYAWAELRTPSATPEPATPASCCTASPQSSRPPAGSSKKSAQTTARNFARASSKTPSHNSTPANASSRPAAPTPTAASSASSSPSSRSAGGRRSLDHYPQDRPPSLATSTNISTTYNPIVPTPAG